MKLKRPISALLICLAACSQQETDPSSAQGVLENEIIIGTHLDLSGPIASWGVGMKNGMNMALKETNANGGIHRRNIRLVTEDTGYDPARAVLAVKKLLNRDQVFAIVGPIGSPPVSATLPLILKNNIPHLFPIAATEIAFYPHHPLKFVNETPFREAIRAGVRHLVTQQNVTRAGILYQDDDFGLEIFKGAQDELNALGLKPVAVTTYKRGATDFSAQIARLRAAGADFVVLGTIIRETIGAAKAAQALGWNAPMICSMGCYTPETAKLGGKAVNGRIYAVAQIAIPYDSDPNPKMRQWRTRYRDQFNAAPNIQAVRGYMTMRLFLEGLRRAGDQPTPHSLARALEDMPTWRDPDLGGAPIDFTTDNHIGIDSVFIARIQNDRWRHETGLIKVLEK